MVMVIASVLQMFVSDAKLQLYEQATIAYSGGAGPIMYIMRSWFMLQVCHSTKGFREGLQSKCEEV